AAAAERLRDRGDHADLTLTVQVAPAAGGHVGAVRGGGLERPLLGDALDDLLRAHDVLEPPAVRRADVHVLDEAQHVAAAAEVLGEREYVSVVRASLDDRVDLHG